MSTATATPVEVRRERLARLYREWLLRPRDEQASRQSQPQPQPKELPTGKRAGG